MTHRVVLIPGDGVGPEVVEAARRAVDATGVAVDWDVRQAGQAARESEGSPLPDQTVEAIVEAGVALKGATMSGGPGPGPASANRELRRALDLWVGVRWVRALGDGAPGVDVVIANLLHEDLYSGVALEPNSPHAQALRELVLEGSDLDSPVDPELSIKFMTSLGAEEAAVASLSWAVAEGRSRVTVVHSTPGTPGGDAVLLDAGRRVAPRYPALQFDDLFLDAAVEELERRPERLDVLLSPVVHVRTLLDLAAHLVGGIAKIPRAQLGAQAAVFDTSHGAAKRHAGRGTANPTAQILAGALLLRHLGERVDARRIESAVDVATAAGVAGTEAFTDAVVAAVRG